LKIILEKIDMRDLLLGIKTINCTLINFFHMKYIAFLLVIITSTACNYSKSGSGKIITEKRNTAAFNKISVSQAIEVDVQLGTQTSVVVEADDNIISNIETVNSEEGKLSVRLKNNISLRNATMKVHISTADITSLTASSAAQIEGKTVISNMERIDFKASSSGKITMDVETPTVDVDASSGSSIILSGRAKNIKAEASSGSNVDLHSLKAETVNAKASSGSTIKVFASVSLDASASSGSNIIHTGGAASVKKNESSGGSVSNK
jgi:hypothetical protein